MKALADRWSCEVETVREVVNRKDFPKPIMPTGSPRLRLWVESEVERWENTKARSKAA